jgi:hypothetical protein
VLPCVDVFVAYEFCIWATNLRTCLALRWGAQLADVPCVCVVDVRWGAQLADVRSVALGRPTCGRALCCIWANILRTCLALRWGAQSWGGRIKKSTSKPKFVLINPVARL